MTLNGTKLDSINAPLNLTCRYIIVQMGQSLEAFLQWKSLVTLFLGCTEAVSLLPDQFLVALSSVGFHSPPLSFICIGLALI